MLRRSGIPLAGAHAVVVGRSNIVGKPMAGLLLREHCTVTLCHSRTRDLRGGLPRGRHPGGGDRQAGVPGSRARSRRAPWSSTSGSTGSTIRRSSSASSPASEAARRQLAEKGYTIVGDVDFDRVAPKAAAITPVPGGVGPLTVAMLLVNTAGAAEKRLELPVSR